MRTSRPKHGSWLYRFFFPALLISMLANLMLPSHALAWKPTTHVFLGEIALQDALDNGKVTIYRVNYRTGEIIGVIGEYNVDPAILTALQNYPAQYHAGILGPDAYPDILTGQQVIHPSFDHTQTPYGSEAWLNYLWTQSTVSEYNTSPIKAFTVGYLTHAAGDMFGHTFINNFSGGEFAITPPAGPANAIKHVILEGYIDKRMDTRTLDASVFDASIGDGVKEFIYDNLVDARSGTFLGGQLLRPNAPGTEFSIPRIFSTLRDNLEKDIATNRKAAEDCGFFDFTCSAIILNLVADYEVAWRNDIDEGLRLWPQVSHDVAVAIFFNSERSADLTTANAILENYATVHLTSMAGLPDFIGLTVSFLGGVIDAITPDFLLEPIRLLKEELLNTLLKEAIGMDKAELQEYLTNPELYFNQVMNTGAGENVTLQQMNSQYLHISDTGFSNPSEHLEYEEVPAIYNTVTMSKLILLSKSEINRLLKDLGTVAWLDQPNVMLGFIPSLDGSLQWLNADGMVFAQEAKAYCQVFMLQPGETPLNCPPMAEADMYVAVNNDPLVISAPGVLGNDADLDGDTITAFVDPAALPAHGSVTMQPNGSFTYTPSDTLQNDYFRYYTFDGTDNSESTSVTINANPINVAPITREDGIYQLRQDTSITVLAPGLLRNDNDSNGDALSAMVVEEPSHGTLSLDASGRFVYTPDPFFAGVDSFQYKASDGVFESESTEVGIEVIANPNVIVANGDTYIALMNRTLNVPAPGLLANDTDRDLLPLEAKDPPSSVIVGGFATFQPDGSFTFSPASNYFGEGEFSYIATDTHADSAVAKARILIRFNNDAPIAKDDQYAILANEPLSVEAPGILANDWDSDYHEEYVELGVSPTDPKTAILVSEPSAGTLTLNPDGSFVYVPGGAFTGRDSFTYKMSDGWDESDVVTVRIADSSVNQLPVADDDTYQILKNTPLVEPAPGLLANDTDGDGDPLRVLPGRSPSNGDLKLNPDGSFVYSPTVDFVGVDNFDYSVTDGFGVTQTAKVTVTVGTFSTNQQPTAANDLATTAQGISVTIAVAANDLDLDGDELTITILTQPISGTAQANDDNIIYTPDAGFVGTDSFTYLASDGKGGSATATVTVIVTDPSVVNQLPTAVNDQATTQLGKAVTIAVITNDSDPEGDPLTVTLLTQPGHGTAVVASNQIVYTPIASFVGSDSFTYRITDDKGGSDTATVNITVVNPNLLLPSVVK